MPLELRIAWRYLQSRRESRILSLNSLIAVAGWIIGVGALTIINAVMNGMQSDYKDKILIASPDIRVLPFGPDLVMNNWQPVLHKVAALPGVKAVAPFVDVAAQVNKPRNRYLQIAQIIGMPADTGTAPVTQVRSTLVAGRFDFRAPGGVDGAVVGQKLAELLDLTPGIDSITILTTNPNRIDPMTGLPPALVKSFLVTGLIETGMYEYDSKYVYVSLDVLQDLLQLDGDVTGLEIRAPSRDEAPELAKRIQDTIGISLRADDWQTQNKTLFSALKLEKFAMTFIFGLIVLVAAFQIVGTLTMVVYDKTREIGILRAMGMPAAVVKRVFFFQGLLIGSAGTVTGLSLGLIVSYVIDRYHLIHLAPDVYFIDHLPAATDPVDVLLIALGSMVIAALATALPARQAARLYPVDAIRHE